MADFYVNYGSSDAKLIAIFRCGKINLKLYQVCQSRFVITKNRKILSEPYKLKVALHQFLNAIFLEDLDNTLFDN